MKPLSNALIIPKIAAVFITILLIWCTGVWAAEPADDSLNVEKIKILDLQTAAKIALAGNPSLAEAQARAAQALEAVRQAKSAYWPRLDLSVSNNRVDLSENAYQSQLAARQALFGSSSTITDPEDYYRASITASWVLFDGFARWFNLEAAKNGEQASKAASDDVRRVLLNAVATAFLSAQLSLENISIAKADEEFNQRLLTEAKLRHKVGTGALSDVLNFEVKANSAQSDRIVAERTYETARIALAALLGIEKARFSQSLELVPLKEVDKSELEAPQLDKLLKEAYTLRPDLLQTDWRVKQAEADVKAKKGNLYPSLSLTASYDGERTDDLGFEGDDFGYSVGVNLSYNIFDGGYFRSLHQQAKKRLREVEKSRENLVTNLNSEIRTTTEQVLSAQKQLVLQQTNARLVKQNRNLVEKEYKAGVGSLVRLNEAQRDLTAAQVRLAVAQVTLRQAWYDLWSATGLIEKQLIRNDYSVKP